MIRIPEVSTAVRTRGDPTSRIEPVAYQTVINRRLRCLIEYLVYQRSEYPLFGPSLSRIHRASKCIQSPAFQKPRLQSSETFCEKSSEVRHLMGRSTDYTTVYESSLSPASALLDVWHQAAVQ
ncbi:hypothetical protein Baya_12529 [Bagarius yarrelli]|uniref:Uncharacterized protein n=1 Tax=Bagarius yarrelli TaxID=175774 RepID=A0A556V3H6_BAGYA|nr:hypothetical protein Baya_12529 [Bagarius yarrelli]